MGLRALLKGRTAVQILSWPHQGSKHRPCGSKSSSLTATLQAALLVRGDGDFANSRFRGHIFISNCAFVDLYYLKPGALPSFGMLPNHMN